VGVLKEHDLAAVKVEASGLKPVRFSTSAVNGAGPGQWLCSPGIGEDRVLAVGNLSVHGLRRIPASGSLLGVELAPALAGIPVHRVDPGGAAERAGLEPGDLIIEIDGAGVGTMRDFVRSLRSGAPSATYELTISRAGTRKSVSITLINGQAGVTLVTEAMGVPVARVRPGSSAAEAGIVPGDIILELDGRLVRDHQALVRMIRTYKPGEAVELTLLRAGDERSVEAKLGYHTGRSDRGDFQNGLGTQLSARAVDFPAVLQHDSILNASQMGGPLVDVRGQVLGINIARAGRVETYALPAQVIEGAIPQLLSGKLPTATGPAVTESGEPSEPPSEQVDDEE
jgi:S1-C subfamily serine protease